MPEHSYFSHKIQVFNFIFATICPDKNTNVTVAVSHNYIHTFVNDGTPTFRDNFLEFLSAVQICHCYSPAHSRQSNSEVKRGVRSIKEVLEKIGKIDKKKLCNGEFNFNTHESQDHFGSPAKSSFFRSIRTSLPYFLERDLQVDDLINIWSNKCRLLAAKKRRKSLGNMVRM